MGIESSWINRVIHLNLGYAIGSVILDEELALFDCQKRIAKCKERQLEIARDVEERKDFKLKKQELKSLSASSSPIEKSCPNNPHNSLELNPRKKLSLTDLRFEEKRNNQDLENFEKELSRLQELILENPLRQQMLPMNYDLSNLDYKPHFYYGEALSFITLKKSSAQFELDILMRDLSKDPYLSKVVDLISQVSANILRCVEKQDQEVCLLASSATLGKVKTLDPIVLREDLPGVFKTSHVFNCSVVTGTILGGLFVGFGAIANYCNVEESSRQEIAASVKVFSYIAQGAIPITSTTNLWAVYTSWKERLDCESRLHSGFPIALQTRKLTDILRENHLLN